MPARSFRFRPRFRAVAIGTIAVGAVLIFAAIAFAADTSRTFALVGGGIGIALGAMYLRSPAWRIVVSVDDEALEVTARGDRRFRLPWGEVVEVVASPSTHTCFVDGGAPERSLLVPGDGASAPYDIEDKLALYDAIVAHVASDRVRQVELLERA